MRAIMIAMERMIEGVGGRSSNSNVHRKVRRSGRLVLNVLGAGWYVIIAKPSSFPVVIVGKIPDSYPRTPEGQSSPWIG